MFTPYYTEIEQLAYKARNMMGNEGKAQLNNFLSLKTANSPELQLLFLLQNRL